MLLIENAAGSGNTLGANFKEVGQILDGVAKKYQKYLGVCIDTQHSFASGYDWRDKKATDAAFKEFDKYIGLDRLIVVQVNDSKVECGANRDKHEHIADGHIGEVGMKNILAHPAVKEMDFCLETPFEGREADIATLKKIRG
jgi:deoxyribonuclease-4